VVASTAPRGADSCCADRALSGPAGGVRPGGVRRNGDAPRKGRDPADRVPLRRWRLLEGPIAWTLAAVHRLGGEAAEFARCLVR